MGRHSFYSCLTYRENICLCQILIEIALDKNNHHRSKYSINYSFDSTNNMAEDNGLADYSLASLHPISGRALEFSIRLHVTQYSESLSDFTPLEGSVQSPYLHMPDKTSMASIYGFLQPLSA